jgi:hypothetical protein
MCRGVNIAVALILSVIFIKAIAASNKTVTGAEVASGSAPSVMLIYNLHARRPDMKSLPVQEAPQP